MHPYEPNLQPWYVRGATRVTLDVHGEFTTINDGTKALYLVPADKVMFLTSAFVAITAVSAGSGVASGTIEVILKEPAGGEPVILGARTRDFDKLETVSNAIGEAGYFGADETVEIRLEISTASTTFHVEASVIGWELDAP